MSKKPKQLTLFELAREKLIPDPDYNVSEVELVYKSKVRASDMPYVHSSKEAYEIFMQSWDDNKLDMVEQGKVMYLNRGNRVLGIYHMSTGGISGTVMDPRLIVIGALKANAVGMILAHNHPSSSLKPSRLDEELTRKIKEGASFLDIKVLDHQIVTRDGYYSFSDEGLVL